MARSVPPGRSAWRVVAVVLIAFLGLVNTVPDISLAWHPFSDFGMQLDAAATVIGIDAGKSADRAGVRLGDRIDVGATPLASRRFIGTGFPSAPNGTHAKFVLMRSGAARHVQLIAETRQRSLADNVTNTVLMLAYASTIIIGAALVLSRPKKMTWAFFLFSTLMGQTARTVIVYLPTSALVADALLWSLSPVSAIPFAIFALRFPNDEALGWRRRAQSVLLWSLVVLVPLGIWNAVGIMLALPVAATNALASILSAGGLLFVALVFALTYVNAPPVDRAKIRWVIFGLLVGESGSLIWNIGSSLPGLAVPWPIAVVNIVLSMEIAVPITVAYAIVRYRVFGIRFVLGRAVVYGLITTMVVVVIALIDFVVGKVLAKTHLAALGEAAVAIALGLSLNSAHKRVERTVDAMLFRSRRRAEQCLERIGGGLMRASSAAAVTKAILSEPLQAFDLVSSAVFRRDGRGRFVRVAAIGWNDTTLDALEAKTPVLLSLSGSPAPLAVADGHWPPGLLPKDTLRPVYALPVTVRDRLDTIVLFGAHATGEDLDPNELHILTRLLAAAGFAYAHLESESATARSHALEAENRTLRDLITYRYRSRYRER